MNSAARCTKCDRGFVVTTCHLAGQLRDETAKAVSDSIVEAPEICDFCSFELAGRGPMERIPAGLRQRTCPSCRTEFLTDHGYPLGTNNPRVRELHEEIRRLHEENKLLLEQLGDAEEDVEN